MNLGYLDTILAFAAVMAGVSLVVTALTQAISGLLGLRGVNLKLGLQELLRLSPTGRKLNPAALAEKILLHPLISDSSFSRRKTGVTWWRYATHVRLEDLSRLFSAWSEALAMPETTKDEQAAKTDAMTALQVPDVLRQVGAEALANLEGEISDWFDSTMNRVSQRFAANTRTVTVAGALVVSTVFIFDSSDVWNRLSTDPELRARMIASSGALIDKAAEMEVGTTNTSARAYRRAAQDWAGQHTNELRKLQPLTTVTNLEAGLAWAHQQLLVNGVADTNRFLGEYEPWVAKARLQIASNDFREVIEERLAFNLIYTPYPETFGKWCGLVWEHIGGILLSVCLLSLGAPFWFNTLRNLSNLKPLLALKDEPPRKKS